MERLPMERLPMERLPMERLRSQPNQQAAIRVSIQHAPGDPEAWRDHSVNGDLVEGQSRVFPLPAAKGGLCLRSSFPFPDDSLCFATMTCKR